MSGPADALFVVAILLLVAVALERPLAGAQVVPLQLDAPGGREPVLEHLRPKLVLPSQLLEAEELLGLHAVLEDDNRGEDLRAQRRRVGVGLARVPGAARLAGARSSGVWRLNGELGHEERRLLGVEMNELAATVLVGEQAQVLVRDAAAEELGMREVDDHVQ